MSLKPGYQSKKDIIYKCNKCGNLDAMIKGETAKHCIFCAKNNNKQLWLETNNEILIMTKSVRQLIEKRKTWWDKIADGINYFCGSMLFVNLHVAWFAVWLGYNSIAKIPFDPYPFGMLTLIVSLEAIMLSTFILISQNKQSEIDELRSELDYRVDIKSEKMTAETLALLQEVHKMLIDDKK